MDAQKQPIYINDNQVKGILTWPLVCNAVEEALEAACNQKEKGNSPFSNQPARSFTFAGDKGVLLSMPGYVGNYSLGSETHNTLACKLVTCFKGNETRNPPLPNILAHILVFDDVTGQLNCIMEGTEITAWRTAAASIVATKYLFLSRIPADKEIVVSIIGCGVQGRSHSIGLCSTFNNIAEICLYNRNETKAKILAEELDLLRESFKSSKVSIRVCSSVADCVKDADVIVTGTFATEPFLDLDMLKKPEVHINAVGAGVSHHSEISEQLYQKATVYIDFWAGAKVELKDLKADIVGEVGTVISGDQKPRQGITIFQAMGMAAEDATVAQAVYEARKIQIEKEGNH